MTKEITKKSTHNHTNPLISDLTPQDKKTIAEFEKTKHNLICPRCQQRGTLSHSGNTNGRLPQPSFTCSHCKQKIVFSSVQRELKQVQVTGHIPGSSSSSSTAPTAIAVPSRIPTLAAATPLQPKPSQSSLKRIRVTTSDDDSDSSTATARPIRAKATQQQQSNNNNYNSLTVSTDNITKMMAMIQSLQERLIKMEQENVEIKNQLQQCNNKNALLEKELLKNKKNVMLNNMHQQQPGNASSSSSNNNNNNHNDHNDEDAHMGTDDEGATTVKGIYASKYAHAIDAGQQEASRSWADKAKQKQNNKNIKKLNTTQKKQTTNPNTNRDNTYRVQAAIRAFSTPESQEFTYVYYPAKSRISRKVQRKNLKALGVINGRVLDIHYPSRTVVAILVHKTYEEGLVNQLKSKKLNPLENYSPLDPATIIDPKYQHLSPEEKTNLAKEKHNARIVRALPYIRDHVSRSVARFFLNEGVLTQVQFDSFIAGWNAKVAAKHEKGNKNAESNNEKENISRDKGEAAKEIRSETPKPADDDVAETEEESSGNGSNSAEQQQQAMNTSL